ncbi:stage III sporulation protein AA [Clostridium bornimense]|uniref:stage III sporulation protein AA n=1 Tax=Clostridium bornimense TaxID=1216932 RepID=UPI001C122C1A|nr:stage III sporulation protein AA [Clostridium bornimense]MBU5315818.1 stage III sporulation protein AA [Clostridium bornimense]
MENWKEVILLLPESVAVLIKKKLIKSIEEIRVSINKPVVILGENKEILGEKRITNEEFMLTLNRLTSYSLYAYKEEIKGGYFTLKGGHRVGIGGQYITDGGNIKTIKHISSLNIRINREVKGCSDRILKYICENGRVYNTLIVSPPKCGKTTLLRDISRYISNGENCDINRGTRVAIIDERSEIACCNKGVPQFDIGLRSDVLDGCPKSKGIMIAIRSLSPDVIVCDEIGTDDDINSLITALNCGVSVITSIHGNDISDVEGRIMYKKIFDNKFFDRVIELTGCPKVGTVKRVYDYKNKRILL